MVPAAGALLWALLLSLGSPAAAGAQGLTSAGTQPVSFRLGDTMTRKYRTNPRTGVPPKRRVIMEDDEDDIVANADRLAGPAAAELLASTVSTDISRLRSWEQGRDGSLEEGVVINAQKNNTNLEVVSTISSTTMKKFSSRFAANIQDPEYRLTTSLPPSTWKSTEHPEHTLPDTSLTQWSTAGSTPSRRPRPSTTAMPPPEDLRLVLMPWGPWHCHCKSGTMSRTRAGRLQGLSGRLRVGALSQLRTEHRPCTYHQCRCDRRLEECPLDSSPCSDASCTSQTTSSSTTTTAIPPLSTRLRPSPLHFLSPSPSPALGFWRQVRTGLEDIWNSLSSVFTKMQPIDKNRR
ncbi:protein MENT [Pteronotus mesoamericanus]|uniref:protein MENT n=1 Tax=Pteronotus mesoamericanus TaxID=1884717 RepID=UPI0023EB1D37|nr:protein MENT [Pteronotus parnellii mesoamericanus]